MPPREKFIQTYTTFSSSLKVLNTFQKLNVLSLDSGRICEATNVSVTKLIGESLIALVLGTFVSYS